MIHNALLLYPLTTSLLIVFFCVFISFVGLAPRFISHLRHTQKKGQPIRSDGPKGHIKTKKGIPTMGGLLILLLFSFYTVFFAKLSDALTFPIFSITILFGLIGLSDDYLKVKNGNSVGIRGKKKLLIQFLIVFVVFAIVVMNQPLNVGTELHIPFVNQIFDIGFFYVIFAALVIVGTANAVNITDGLDGLASLPLILAFSYFIIEIWYASQFGKPINLRDITYLQLFNIAILLTIIVATLTAFLYFNCNPAKVFMGDTGSLALGGLLGTIAVLFNREILLLILGGLFVIESLSVMIQVGYFKLTGGKRVFKMAPIHHHFELLGWSENQVVTRFWIFAFCLFLFSFLIN